MSCSMNITNGGKPLARLLIDFKHLSASELLVQVADYLGREYSDTTSGRYPRRCPFDGRWQHGQDVWRGAVAGRGDYGRPAG